MLETSKYMYMQINEKKVEKGTNSYETKQKIGWEQTLNKKWSSKAERTILIIILVSDIFVQFFTMFFLFKKNLLHC
jgi:hypothetical protein